jgi:ubiquinone/menaquinone biosynthesis C-methylase UbiE
MRGARSQRRRGKLENSANDEAITAWNTVLFDKFVRFRHLLTTGLSRHGDEALRREPPPERGQLLDVGCGFGDTTIDLARRLEKPGSVTGIDAAANFIELARRDAAESGLDNLRFLAADVQTADLGGPYDYAFSRFGTMFFSSPVAALRNVRRALRPGAELVLVVWRKREDNAWLHAAEQCVRAIVPEREDSNAVTCGPGPFSMASADLVSEQLLRARFTEICFTRFDTEICIGRDLTEAVEFALAIGPAGELLRLAGDEAERYREPVIAGLRGVLSQFARTDGVYAPSSTWLIASRADG